MSELVCRPTSTTAHSSACVTATLTVSPWCGAILTFRLIEEQAVSGR
jgi:hypothetical protein